jgi:hypothetical protein
MITAATYHGKPCNKGHGTLRYKRNWKCVGCSRERRKVYRDSPGGKAKFAAMKKRRRMKTRYGITEAQYQEMHTAQKGLCKICLLPSSNGKRLAVDHDHKTGKIRGLLCGRCNPALGLFFDSPHLCRRAAEYLD